MTQPDGPTRPTAGRPRSPSGILLLILGAMLASMWLWRSTQEVGPRPRLDYSTLYRLLQDGKVESVVVKGRLLEGKLRAPEKLEEREVTLFQTTLPERDDELLPLARQKGVHITVESETRPFAIDLLLGLLPWVLIIGVWLWLSRRTQRMLAGGGAGPLSGILRTRQRKFERSAEVNVTFDDVAGLKQAKQDLREVVDFLREPARFQRLGGKVPRGVLLVGPPGTGKTLLARAVAGESGVPFFSISGSEFIELFVGVGASRVRDLFDEAKKAAPAIVFIDEIDAVGRARGAGLGGGHDEREQTLNQLLAEMDGFSRNDLTVVLAATNRPDVLDPALLRPGRFDRRVIIDRPERAARQAILAVHARNKPIAGDVDWERIAGNTPGFSGADLANLVNEAALAATRRGADSITAADMSVAYDKIVLGDPREAKLEPEEKRRIAIHEAGHAVVAHSTRHAEPLERVSIIPRGMSLGATQQSPAGERHIMTQPEIEAQLCVLMAGYAAEREILGDISSGAESDLQRATEIATKMVAHYGMSPEIGPVYHEHRTEHPFLGQRLAQNGGTSDATVHDIESATRVQLLRALQQASACVAAHRREIDILVEALLVHETLDRHALGELLGPAAKAAAYTRLGDGRA